MAYAIYLLTREEVITTNYILNLRDYLDRTGERGMEAGYHSRLSCRRLCDAQAG